MTITISDKHTGGNIKVIAAREGLIQLEQDLRDTESWWFYWNFSATSTKAQSISFEFMNREVLGPWGPAVSHDGLHWDWLGADSLLNRQSFSYMFDENETVYFCISLPYQVHHFEAFYAQIGGHPLIKRKVLGYSEAVRAIPLLTVGNGRKDIVLTCRHHACESTPGYVLEGLIQHFIDSDSSLLKSYKIHIIPFVDIDGVEKGDQGKSRAPRDHNRDYTEQPLYRSTCAIMDYVRTIDLCMAIDFHCPNWGDYHDYPFLVKKESPIKEQLDLLGFFLKASTSNCNNGSKIVYHGIHDLEMGEKWNVPTVGKASNFFVQQNAQLSCTLEFPYFGTGTAVITTKSCRQFGKDFAIALEQYFKNNQME